MIKLWRAVVGQTQLSMLEVSMTSGELPVHIQQKSSKIYLSTRIAIDLSQGGREGGSERERPFSLSMFLEKIKATMMP